MPAVLRLQHVSVPMPPARTDEARAFYVDGLGLTELTIPSSLDGIAVLWFRASDDGDEVHLYAEKEEAARVAGQHLCLQVDDIDALAAKLATRGIDVQETIEIPGRPRRVVEDPFGNQIELMEMRPAPA
ncbi:MAG: VOC family protein [Chloroflexota bacterium]|nr:VOC family protein [Chloroflexota bacterium]